LVAIVDAGVAPGCSNLILGRMEALMDEATRFKCVVGGLPVIRHWPFQYKAPYSPSDVLEGYKRPARLRRGGKAITLPALSEIETLDFPEIGALEAFNTDGLRTLLKTSDIPDMTEKTVRYPGHAEWILGLRDTGFFDEKPLELGGVSVSPLSLTGTLLEKVWAFEEDEEDLTIMRVQVEGRRRGRLERHTFDLFDRYDRVDRVSSMARTTGYTCTAMVRMLAKGLYTEPGITPPEFVGREQPCFDFVMEELARRNILFQHTKEDLAE
jgi:saccharopine dehydrogenase-like NADP-dependent oxidoreductase